MIPVRVAVERNTSTVVCKRSDSTVRRVSLHRIFHRLPSRKNFGDYEIWLLKQQPTA